MYRKYYLVEVVLLLLLSHSGWNGPSVTLLSCTSEASKLVREVVQTRFMPVVSRYRLSLPLECPLHPRRDMFGWLQTELIAGEDILNCPVCGQTFRCENTFANHWDASHAKSIGMPEETVCLDGYCDIFRCDVHRLRHLKQRFNEEEELRRQRGLNRLLKTFREEDSLVQTKMATCDPESMQRRHYKCRSLLRQCTIGMLANLSSKDFQDIEDDLDQSICSFLTCDRYWDDYDAQVHRVPALVIAIFGLLIIGFFSLCYYGTWVLLEKHPMCPTQLCVSCKKKSNPDSHFNQRKQKHKRRQNSPETEQPQQLPDIPSILTDPSTQIYQPTNKVPKYRQPIDYPSSTNYYTEKAIDVRNNYSDCESRYHTPVFDYRHRDAFSYSQNHQSSPDFRYRIHTPDHGYGDIADTRFTHRSNHRRTPQYLTPERALNRCD